MNNQQIIAIYEAASRLTREMLAAAQASDWDQLVACERACAARLSPLISEQPDQTPTAEFQQRKATLIRAMLEDDARIRVLVEPWLEQLSGLIGHSQRQTRLQETYGVVR